MLQRESEQEKVNAVTLRVIHSGGVITEEEAIKELNSIIGRKRRELLKIVLREKSSSKSMQGFVLDNDQSVAPVLHE